MPITYTWGIVQLDAYPEKDGLTDVVFHVHWNLTGDDGIGHTGYAYGSVDVSLDKGGAYTPFAELTQEQVLSWVKDSLGEEQVESLEDNVATQIKDLKEPPVLTLPLPWQE